MIQLVHIRIYSSPLDHHLCSEKQKNDDIIWIWTMCCIVTRTLILLIAYSSHHPKDQGTTNSLWQKTQIQHLPQPFAILFLHFLCFETSIVLTIAIHAHKTKTETTNRWGTTNSKPPGPIITMGQSETLNSSQIIFITLFSAGANCAIILSQNHFPEPNSHVLTFLHPILWYRITY
jgi:hypothetical protein